MDPAVRAVLVARQAELQTALAQHQVYQADCATQLAIYDAKVAELTAELASLNTLIV